MSADEEHKSLPNELTPELNPEPTPDLTEDELLPTIALVRIPHPAIPELCQHGFEYVERWQWAWETERVETGQWFFAAEGEKGQEL